MGLFSHIFWWMIVVVDGVRHGSVSDDGTACPQFAKNGLLSRRTHMMTRNIVNILPLSLISSH